VPNLERIHLIAGVRTRIQKFTGSNSSTSCWSSYTHSEIYSGFLPIREGMANASIDLHLIVVDRLG